MRSICLRSCSSSTQGLRAKIAVVLTSPLPSQLYTHHVPFTNVTYSRPLELSRFRISAEIALEHPYVAQFHDKSVERTATDKVNPLIPDEEKKTTAQYRTSLYEEVR